MTDFCGSQHGLPDGAWQHSQPYGQQLPVCARQASKKTAKARAARRTDPAPPAAAARGAADCRAPAGPSAADSNPAGASAGIGAKAARSLAVGGR
uniref:Uncharacterized protein n=1 Tax=Oryza glumipatula TaxID=40148 RepID=A0A0D9Z165_9ORYZ